MMTHLTETIIGTKLCRAERLRQKSQASIKLGTTRATSEHDKLVEYCKMIGRCVAWADHVRKSMEYTRGRDAAKKSFTRRSR
jgi:hypothetical protein